MRASDKTPSELIRYIGDIIRERQSKDLPTYYTISIEQYDKNTPVAEKEESHENFERLMLKYMSDYNLTSITVSLYSGKSRRVKQPFQVFKVPLKKQNPTIMLGGVDKEVQEIQQAESSISVHRYYDEKFEMQMRIMRVEMEKQSLSERVALLTEKYEEKIKDIERKSHEQTKELEDEISRLESEIRDYEKEITGNEKAKHNSLGNIALGSVGARVVENFAKSDLGISLLKSLLGKSGYDTLQGHLAGIEAEKQNPAPQNDTARIIAEPEQQSPRQVALGFIQKVGEQLNDMYLRMLYDIAEMAAKNTNDLQILWNLSQQIQKQRNSQGAAKTAPAKETKEQTDP
ncbi:MAG: hypothetical protein ACXVPQ_05405, partial [Bacteroidia bacterium]